MIVELGGRRHLEEPALVHDRDAIGHGQRFFLIMGDDDEGDADLMLQADQLQLHLFSEFAVEGGERLVQEQHFRTFDQRAGERHALALSAGQLIRFSRAEAGETHHRQCFLDTRADLGLGNAGDHEPIGDVVGDTVICGNTA